MLVVLQHDNKILQLKTHMLLQTVLFVLRYKIRFFFRWLYGAFYNSRGLW